MSESFSVSKEYMIFHDGTVALLNTSWDVEKKMRSEDKGSMEYAVAVLHSDDVFSPVDSWIVQWPEQQPDWLALPVAEHEIKSMAEKWAKRHVFQNRLLPVQASRPREEYYVRDCRSVNLNGYKTTVMAAGNTTVNVRRAETSVYLLDPQVKLKEYRIPDTTNVFTLYHVKPEPELANQTAVFPPAMPRITALQGEGKKKPLIHEQLMQFPWLEQHVVFAHSFGTRASIQKFIDGYAEGAGNLGLEPYGSDEQRIGIILGRSQDRDGLLKLLERCPAQLRTNPELVFVCDWIMRMEERGSLPDRERIVLNSLKDSFDRFERGSAYGCLPVHAADKFSSNVIHYNQCLSVEDESGYRHQFSVYCNHRYYLLDHISEERCAYEKKKLLQFAADNGYLVEKHTGWAINVPRGVEESRRLEAEEALEINCLREAGIGYSKEYFDDGYYVGDQYTLTNMVSHETSRFDGCLSVCDPFYKGMRSALREIGLSDLAISTLRDQYNGPIADLITEGDLYHKTTSICSLISNAEGSFQKSQTMSALLQPALQESAELAL